MPPTGAALTFTGAPGGSTDDCQGLSGSYSSFTVQGDYPGKITMGGGITAASFEMWAGTLDQPNRPGGTDLNVTGYFNWYGGTINSTDNLANVNLNGAEAVISGSILGVVTLGSNLNVINGATVTIWAGTISVTNNIAIEISPHGEVDVDPGQGDTFTIQQLYSDIHPQINIYVTGSLQIRSGTAVLATGVYNNGGDFSLMAGTTMNLTGDTGQWVPAGWQSNGHSYAQDSGFTKLSNGSTLQVKTGLDAIIAGGTLTTISDADGSLSTISGNFTFLGGDIYMDEGTSTTSTEPSRSSAT